MNPKQLNVPKRERKFRQIKINLTCEVNGELIEKWVCSTSFDYYNYEFSHKFDSTEEYKWFIEVECGDKSYHDLYDKGY